jgi:small-conductance mechanosensitive channel
MDDAFKDVADRTWSFNEWPQVLRISILSLIVVASSYLAGRLAGRVVSKRLGKLARRTAGTLDDTVVTALSRRVPFWGLLLGLYVAVGFWPLPDHLISVLNSTLFVVAAASATFLLADILATLASSYSQTIDALPNTSLTENVVRIAIVCLGLLVILNGLGLSITPILGALGVGGLAVALALQDTLANLFAGFYITVAQQIRVGDFIRLESGDEGYVVDIDWRSTRIRKLPNNIVLIPNAKLSQSVVTNYYLPEPELAVLVAVGVDYDSDLQEVERVTIDVAKDVMQTVAGGVATFEPFIRYHTFADSSVDFTVILRGREFVDQHLIKHEFVKRLHRRYKDEGIVIPFPIRTIVQRDGGALSRPPGDRA